LNRNAIVQIFPIYSKPSWKVENPRVAGSIPALGTIFSQIIFRVKAEPRFRLERRFLLGVSFAVSRVVDWIIELFLATRTLSSRDQQSLRRAICAPCFAHSNTDNDRER
jgi:hypothetical protein